MCFHVAIASTQQNEFIIPNDTVVTVKADDIYISRATVQRHYYEDGVLMYEVTTLKSRFHFPHNFITVAENNEEYSLPDATTKNRFSTSHPKDDRSITSTYTGDGNGHKYYNLSRPRVLMPNQFGIKGQPDHHSIQTSTMLQHATNWEINWKDPTTDPKDFYEDLKSRIEHYGIWLKGYMELH